jgi:inosose dehydratase
MEDNMKVEIATCPCSWGVFWPDGSPSHVPYKEFLDQAAASGYIGLELGPVGYLPTDKASLGAELSSRGLKARAGTACYKVDEAKNFNDFRQRADDLCRLLKAFDIQYLMMMDESPFGADKEAKKRERSRVFKCYDIIKDYIRYAQEEYGITVVFHPHSGTIVETEEEILEFINYTDSLLCFDTGHHQVVNGSPEQGDTCAVDFYRKHYKRIPYLHFKNVDAGLMKKRLANPNEKLIPFCALEEGIIDFVELRRALEETNFNGIGVVEQDMAGKPAEESFALSKKNREYLARINMI